MKAQVYSAEDRLAEIFRNTAVSRTTEIKGATLTLPDERRFGALETVQRYVDHAVKVCADVYPVGPCEVMVGRSTLKRKAYWRDGKITLPRLETTDWAWRELVVLHEVAHHLTPWHGHDSIFAGAFVHLLNEMMGPEAGWLASVLYMDNGVTIQTKGN